MSAQAGALECLLCYQRYSREDVESGLYRLETMVCSRCYARAQRLPYSRSCFGKPTTVAEVRGRGEVRMAGFDPRARECAEECPDRAVCALVVDPPERVADRG